MCLTCWPLRKGEVHPLLLERQHLAEQLLAGLEDVDPAFRVWLIAKRNMLRDRMLRGLESAIASKPAGSQEESTLAPALLNLDPDARGCLLDA